MSMNRRCVLQFVPVLGLAWAHSTPSFDDVEKLLQVLGLIDGLLISCLGGVIFADYTKDVDRGHDIMGALFGSFELFSLAMFMIVVLYMYTLFFVHQEDGRVSMNELHRWWNPGGRLILTVIPMIIIVGIYLFIMAVTFYFEGIYKKRGETFTYGCMGAWWTIIVATVVGILTIHGSFVWRTDVLDYVVEEEMALHKGLTLLESGSPSESKSQQEASSWHGFLCQRSNLAPFGN